MNRIYSTLIEMMAAAVFIIPIWCIYNRLWIHNWKRMIGYMVFGCYLAAVLSLVGFPDITFVKMDFNVNMIPFAGMAEDFTNTCLNVLLFIPFGFFLPILWSRFRDIRHAAFAGFLASFLIEVSQIFTFRSTDINDIITNTAGTAIGYFIARWITDGFRKRTMSDSGSSDFYVISGSVVGIMFFLQPFVSFRLWEMVL